MRAVRTDGAATADLVEMPEPTATGDDVVVDVLWASMCASDRKRVAGGTDEPRVLGHELTATAPDGTAVAVHPDIGCGTCPRCTAGWTNRCPRSSSIGNHRDGGFADRLAVPPSQLVPLDGIPPDVGAMLEPLACCLHAVRLLPDDHLDEAAVVGAGAMGILAMWVLQARGSRVTVVQRSQPRRRMAAELGADAVLGPDDAVSGAPGAVLVTAPGGTPLAWATGHAAVGGAVHVFAGSPGGAQVDANAIHYRHLQVVGSTGSTVADLATAADLVRDGTVPLADIPHRRIGLADLPGALTTDPRPQDLRTLVPIGTDGTAAHVT